MSGVIIDVEESGSERAKRNLKDLNRELANMVNFGGKTDRALKGDKGAQNFKRVSKEAKGATKAVDEFQVRSFLALRSTATGVGNIAIQLRQLKSAAIAIGVAFAGFKLGAELARAGDGVQNLQNRLKLVTKDMAQVIVLQRELQKISKETRSELAGTVNTFVDFSKATEKLGISQDRLIKVVRTLNQANQLAGSSFESIQSAMVQFGQGIASGQLRGQELRSVLEQSKYLGQELASALGLSTGQLYAFAEAGKLSSQQVITALEKMSSKVEKDFAATTGSVSTSMSILKQSLSTAVGDITNFLEINKKLSRGLLNLGDDFTTGADAIIFRLDVVKSAVRGYVRELSKVKLDMFTKLNIGSVDRGIRKNSQEMIKSLQSFFSKQADVELPQTKIEKLFKRFKMPKEEDISFFDPSVLGDNVKSMIDIVAAMARNIELNIKRIATLFPIIRGPMVKFIDSFLGWSLILNKELDTAVYKGLLPFRRELENVAERATIFFAGDNRMGRAYVRAFQAGSLKDFAAALQKINQAQDDVVIRFDNIFYIANEKYRHILQPAVIATQDWMVKIGLLEQRIIRIRDTRFDRLLEYFRLFGDAAKRVYADVFAPDVNLFLYKLKVNAYIIAKTLADAFEGTFTLKNGLNFGRKLVTGVLTAFKFIGKAVYEIFTGTGDPSKIGVSLGTALLQTFLTFVKSIGKFSGGFFTGIAKQIAEEFASIDWGSVYDKLKTATKAAIDFVIDMFRQIFDHSKGPLDRVEKRIRDFGKTIKKTFFDIWDKVVGHSYWPDMIQGIIDHTKRLAHANDGIRKFKDSVLAGFRDMFERVGKLSESMGSQLGAFKIKIQKVDWGDAVRRITSSLAGILTAVFLATSKSKALSGIGRGLGISLLFSIFSDITGHAIRDLGPMLGAAGGTLFGQFFKGWIKAMFDLAVTFGNGLQIFVSKALGEISPLLEKGFNAVSHLIPLFTNSVIHSLVGIGLAYSLFKKNGFKDIVTLIFGKKADLKAGEQAVTGIGSALLAGYGGDLNKITSKFGNTATAQLVKKLIVAPHFAAVAAGIMSVAMTDAFNIFQTSFAALPFIALAIFGRDGAAKVLKDATNTLGRVLFSLGHFVKDTMFKVFPKTSTLWQMVDVVINTFMGKLFSFTRRVRGAQGGLGMAVKGFFGNFVTVAKNIIANREKYLGDKMSFEDMLFTKSKKKRGGVTTAEKNTFFKRDLQNMFSVAAATRVPFMGKTGGDLFKEGLKSTKEGGKEFVAAIMQTAKSSNDAMVRMGAGLTTIMSRTMERLKVITIAGLAPILGIFKGTLGKIALFGILALGITGVANASTGATDVITGMSLSLGHLMIGMAAAPFVIIGTVKAIRMLTVATAQYFIIRNKLLAGGEGWFTARMKAGWQAVEIATRGARDSVSKLADSANKTLFRQDWWAERVRNVKAFAKELKNIQIKQIALSAASSLKNAPGKIGRKTKDQGDLFLGSFTDRKGRLNLPKAAGKGIFGVGKMALGGLATITGIAAPVLGPILAVGAALTGLAALITGVFGPFDSFTANLKVFGDKLLGLVGFSPKSSVGKQAKLVDEFGKIDSAGNKFDVRKDILRVDFDKLSGAEIRLVSERLEQLKEEMLTFDKLKLDNGKLTQAEVEEQKKIVQELKNILARLPGRPGVKLDGANFSSRFEERQAATQTSPHNTVASRIGRTIGFEAVSDFENDIDKTVGDFIKDFGSFFVRGWRNEFEGMGKILDETTRKAGKKVAAPVTGFVRNFGDVVANDFGNLFKAIRRDTRDSSRDFLNAPLGREREATGLLRQFEGDVEDPKHLDIVNAKADRYHATLNKLSEARRAFSRGNASKEYVQQLVKEARAIEEDYFAHARYYGLLAQINNQRKEFQGGLKRFNERSKKLGLDFGQDGEKFAGSNSDVLQVNQLSEQYDKFAAILKKGTISLSQQRNIAREMTSILAEAADIQKRTEANQLLGTRIKFQKEAFGDNASDSLLMRQNLSSNGTRAQLQNLVDEFDKARSRLETASTSTPVNWLKGMQDQMQKARADMINILDLDKSFEGINSGISAAGGEVLSLTTFASASNESIIKLASSIKNLHSVTNSVQEAMEDLDNTPASFSRYQTALRNLAGTMAQVRSQAAQSLANTLRAIGAANLTGDQKLYAQQLYGGIKVDDDVFGKGGQGTLSGLEQRKAQLLADQALNEENLRTPNKWSSPLDKNSVNGLNLDPKLLQRGVDITKELASVNKQIADLGKSPEKPEKDKYGFKELLADVKQAGIEISDLGFARLSDTSRKTLSNLANEVHKIEETLEKSKPTDDVSNLLKQRAELFKQMRVLTVEGIDKTGKDISDALSRSGIDESSDIHKLSANQITHIISLDKLIQRKREDAFAANSLDEYLAGMREVVDLQSKQKYFLELATHSVDKFAENINSVFSTSLETISLSNLGVEFAEQLSVVAMAVRKEYNDFLNGKDSPFIKSNEHFIESMRKLANMGELITIFNDIGELLSGSLERGAMNAFERMKQVAPDFAGSFKDFLKIPEKQRNRFVAEGESLEILKRIGESRGLTPDMVGVLDQFTSGQMNARETVAEFERVGKEEFQKILKATSTPLELNNERLEALNNTMGVMNDTLRSSNALNPASNSGAATSLQTAVAFAKQFGTVTSTIRTPEHNRRVGGVANSNHLTGRAIDIARKSGVSHATIAKGFRDAGYSLIESLDEGDHSHFAFAWGKKQAEVIQAGIQKGLESPDMSKPYYEGSEDLSSLTNSIDKASLRDEYYRVLHQKMSDINLAINEATRMSLSQRDGDLFNLRDSGINLDVLAMATNNQLQTLSAMQDYINDLKLLILDGNEKGIDTSNLQKTALDTADAMNLLARGIENLRQHAIEAGENLAQSVDRGLKDTLVTALTGGDWKKSLKGFLDDFTKTVVTSFVDGLMEPITGENGILSNLFRRIGSGIFGGGADIGGQIAGGMNKLSGGRLGQIQPYHTPGAAGGGAGSGFDIFGSLFSKGGDSLMAPLANEAPKIGGSFADELLNAAPDVGDRMALNLGKGLGQLGSISQGGGGMFGAMGSGGAAGSGFGGMSQYGIAGLAGSIFGTLLGLFISKKKGYKSGGLIGGIPGFKGGGFLKFLSPMLMLLTTLGGKGLGDIFKFLSPAAAGAGAIGMLGGGRVVGPGSGTSDSVPLWGSNGEFMVNAKATKAWLPLLEDINANKFATGGLIGKAPTGTFLRTPTESRIDQSKIDRKSRGETHINLKVIGDVSRQTRKEIVQMMPQIAQGVNADNRESGYYVNRS
jgi:tape measure domain-containing protein